MSQNATVCGGGVTHRRVVATLKAERDQATVLVVPQPSLELAGRFDLNTRQGGGFGIAEPVEHVGEFGIFW